MSDSAQTARSAVSATPLSGVRVVLMRYSDFRMDSRVRKEASSLCQAGAEVSLVGVGNEVAPDQRDAPYAVHLITPHPAFVTPRLGREDIWWPLRVLVNLTYTRFAQWRHGRKTRSFGYIDERLVQVVLEQSPDVVQAIDAYTLRAAVEAKRGCDAALIYECLDLVGDVDYHDDVTNERWRRIECELVHQADAVVAVSRPMAEVLVERHGIEAPTLVFSGPWSAGGSRREPHRPPRVLFQGAFLPNRNLVGLVRAFALMKHEATLTLMGFGEQADSLRALAAELGIVHKVSVVPPVDPTEVVDAASEFDVGVICYRADTPNLVATVPNKLLDYLGAGLALVVSDLPGHRSVLDGTDAALFVDPASPIAIARGLDEVVSDLDLLRRMKEASALLAETYVWERQGEVLVDVYRGVLERKGRRSCG